MVAGFTPIIDMTAEDILRQNVRYLTLSKSFDTFFSFGPCLVTPDAVDDVNALTVSTVINGRVHAENTVAHMTFPPDELVALLSTVMTLLPGDIISTGTPGAGAHCRRRSGDLPHYRVRSPGKPGQGFETPTLIISQKADPLGHRYNIWDFYHD